MTYRTFHSFSLLRVFCLAVCLLWTVPLSLAASSSILVPAEKRDSTVVLVGDLQRTNFWELIFFREQNDAAREVVLKQIAEEEPAMVVLLGDIVSQGDNEDDWESFSNTAAPLRRKNIPMVPVIGNHDYYGDNGAALRLLSEHFPGAGDSLWRFVRFHDLVFLLLNSNFDEMAPGEIDAQDRWYRAALAGCDRDTSVAAVIVCSHHPPFTNSTIVSPSAGVQQHFLRPFLASRKAQVYFSGHCHSYEHFMEAGKHFIVSGGGGGPRQRVETDPERRPYRDLYDGPSLRDFHYCRLLLDGDAVRIQMVTVDATLKEWRVGDTIRIPLPRDRASR